MKILTIGAATQDIIIEYHDDLKVSLVTQGTPHVAFREGSKIEIEKLHYASGGGATNSAVSFKQQGFHVSTFFKIGDDAAGKCITQNLEQQEITAHHAVSKTVQTGTSFIIPSSKKDCVIFTYRGANKTIENSDIPKTIFEQQNCLYITSLTDKAADILPHLTHLAQKKIEGACFKVAVNPGISQLTKNIGPLKAALPNIDVLITNSYEMNLFMESLKERFFKSTGVGIIQNGPQLARTVIAHKKITFTFYEYCKEILSYGVKRVVVTDGKNGVYVATRDHLYFHPALPTQAVNSLGAGDAFGSCFMGSLLQGKTTEDAIRSGILNASSVIMQHDAQSGLLTKSEINRYLHDLDNDLLLTFKLNS